MENGTVTLVGATTENPSFELNSALLSRCKVFVMHALDAAALDSIIERAESLLQRKLPLTPKPAPPWWTWRTATAATLST